MKSWISRVGALAVWGMLGAVLVPGCVIRVGPGTGEETEPNSTAGSTGGQTDPPSKTDEEIAAETLAQLDPDELAFASARAGVTSAFLGAKIESLGLDPTTLDDATLLKLMEQYMPEAAQEADAWLATIDKDTLPKEILPKFECEGQFGCERALPCQYWGPSVNHICFVVGCGDAKCGLCPEWVSDILKHIVLKSWCAYVCTQTATSPPKIVAYGAGGFRRLRTSFSAPFAEPTRSNRMNEDVAERANDLVSVMLGVLNLSIALAAPRYLAKADLSKRPTQQQVLHLYDELIALGDQAGRTNSDKEARLISAARDLRAALASWEFSLQAPEPVVTAARKLLDAFDAGAPEEGWDEWEGPEE